MDYQKKSFRSRPSNRNFLDNYDQTFRNKSPEADEFHPTHRCKICGALWRLNPPSYPNHCGPEGCRVCREESWSLTSPTCEKCCDNAAMGDQIEPLNDSGS